jgi:hypothetical protein
LLGALPLLVLTAAATVGSMVILPETLRTDRGPSPNETL